jgi:hypothetical protein
MLLQAALLSFLVLAHGSAMASSVVIDSAAAKAVLQALKNPDLTHAQALDIARLPGNQGLIRKAERSHVVATADDFADALVDAAHGTPATRIAEKIFAFDRVRPKADALLALIARIEGHPRDFEAWVVERVSQFSPSDPKLSINGYLVAGGTNGGFAFGEPKFYLNINYFDEFDTARIILAHELYHAVQGAYSVDSDDIWLKPESRTAKGKARQQLCVGLAGLFSNLYQEGSASYVGDTLLLDPASGPLAKKTREEMEVGLHHLSDHATLLELSVTGLEAPKPVPFEDIYALDFYVPEPLYKLGYAMAKAIATDLGPSTLTALLKEPGYRFVRRYLDLPAYGKDAQHPKLGANTIDAVETLASGCKASQG